MGHATTEAFSRPEGFDTPAVIYVTSYCGFCRLAERLLDRRGIAYTAVDVTHDDEARQWLVSSTGRYTVPQIFLRGQSIGGYQELASLDRRGQLDALLSAPKS